MTRGTNSSLRRLRCLTAQLLLRSVVPEKPPSCSADACRHVSVGDNINPAVGNTAQSTTGELAPAVPAVGVDKNTEASKALAWYTSPGKNNYAVLNRYLRNGQQPQQPDLDRHVEEIDALINRSAPLTKPWELYRGFASWSYASEVHIGDKVVDRAFMSTSTERSVGNFYARRHALVESDLENAVLLELRVPPGMRVLNVAELVEGTKSEAEVLLPRGTAITIEHEDKWRGVRVLNATVLLP